jgi:hypothetical protein
MAVSTAEQFFAVDTMEALRDDIVAMILARHTSTPRHLQVELGPSEIGHPCSRKLAYSMTNDPVPKCNPQWDPLPSIIGTATHTWLESAAVLANTELGRERWLTETKVHVTERLSGSCDLYDCDTETVIDYKVPGVNQFGLLSRDMSPVYRAQAHLYGKGFVNAGRSVKTVAIMLLPRGGTLAKAKLWSEPYDQGLADETIERWARIGAMVADFDTAQHPDRFLWFEKKGYMCVFCPWFSPKPSGPQQCSGDGIPLAPGTYTP